MMSTERVLEYCHLESEKQPVKPQQIADSWPAQGGIEFRNVFYCYFKGADPVLRGLSFVIKPKEKIDKLNFQELLFFPKNKFLFTILNRNRGPHGSWKEFIDWGYLSIGSG